MASPASGKARRVDESVEWIWRQSITLQTVDAGVYCANAAGKNFMCEVALHDPSDSAALHKMVVLEPAPASE